MTGQKLRQPAHLEWWDAGYTAAMTEILALACEMAKRPDATVNETLLAVVRLACTVIELDEGDITMTEDNTPADSDLIGTMEALGYVCIGVDAHGRLIFVPPGCTEQVLKAIAAGDDIPEVPGSQDTPS